MAKKPTYEELEQRIKGLKKEVIERKQVEEALRESLERLDLAVKGTDLGLWDWNIKTGNTTYSESWAEMLGYGLNELAPNVSTWETLIHSDDKEKITAILNKHFERDDYEYNLEFRMKTKAGGW